MNINARKGCFCSKEGFTLIELLVVVLIIGVLASVATAQYRKTVELNEAKMILANMHSAKKAENLYKLANGTYTLNWEELDFMPSAMKLTNNKRYLYATDGQKYEFSDGGDYWHVFGHSHDSTYSLYLSFESTTQLCYPRGTDKGKRVCRALGCAENKLDSQYCSFTYRP